LQVDDSSTMSAPFRASQIVAASQASVGNLPAQALWWRVRARNADGRFGPFSATRRFVVQASPSTLTAPTLSSPASDARFSRREHRVRLERRRRRRFVHYRLTTRSRSPRRSPSRR